MSIARTYFLLRMIGQDIDAHRARKAARKAWKRQANAEGKIARDRELFKVHHEGMTPEQYAAKLEAQSKDQMARIQAEKNARHKAKIKAETEKLFCPVHIPETQGKRYYKSNCPVCEEESVTVPTDAELDAVVNQATALLLAGTETSTVAGYVAAQLGMDEHHARDILLSIIANTGLTSESVTSTTVTAGGNA